MTDYSKNVNVTNEHGVIVGWISKGGCQNPTCKKHMRAGLMWHAIPVHSTLPCYHFKTRQQGEAALVEVFQPHDEFYRQIADARTRAGGADGIERAKQKVLKQMGASGTYAGNFRPGIDDKK